MARRTLRDLRAEADALAALGLDKVVNRKPRSEPSERRPKPSAEPARVRVVWAVCDVGGRTVATYDYPKKADAEAHAALLKSKGKGAHFVRSLKEPMPG